MLPKFPWLTDFVITAFTAGSAGFYFKKNKEIIRTISFIAGAELLIAILIKRNAKEL